ncbi:hypothetical protein KFL_001800110 [Klebsormidium nitens]|uniref:NAD(P)-binding domain-containing protein n=1 Tax=Klebsormidium nitens TaxID=105231 RepID=A0A1Y1I163_KLENI|nr:hypothetical protein KFL_001800110 [Klebsormidium nitens]|eukprot:GAQ84203.1 hypothetical protein KFL_001800110 [Klebsormidium nitens]
MQAQLEVPRKVLVVGSSSGVGLQVTKALLSAKPKFEVYALVRNEEKTAAAIGPEASRVKFVTGDVTNPDALQSACAGKDAVVCAVGARQGWRLPLFGLDQQTPRKVDFEGVTHLVSAAAAARVPRFVLISSAAVTRPFSFIHILLNTMAGRVLHWKLLGENYLRKTYGRDGLGYYVIRPGGLNDNEGAKAGIIMDQGDKTLGMVSRADVAAVAVGCLEGLSPDNVTFEVVNDKQNPYSDLQPLFAKLHSD